MKVKVYIKSGDPYSDMIRNLLKYNNVDFEIFDVSRNIERFKEMQEISGQTNTPVIQIEDKIFLGFDREKLKEVLGLSD